MKKPILILFTAAWATLVINAQQTPTAAPVVGQVPTADDPPVKAPPAAHAPIHRPVRKRRPDPGLLIQGAIDSQPLRVDREAGVPENVKAALAISQSWLEQAPTPICGQDGRILYLYGKGAPTIICSEYHACEIDLAPGETVDPNSIDIGDNGFLVETRTTGSGMDRFTYLVVKPKTENLDTSLIVPTSGHQYWMHLISRDKTSPYMARVAFQYPEDETRKKQVAADELAAQMAQEQRERAAHLSQLDTQKPIRNWNYKVKLHGRDAKYLRPKSIGDDGAHCYIMLPEQAHQRGLPIIELRDARGPIPTNSHWNGNELIVDAVFEKACLLEGVGRKQQRACITNKGLQEN